MKRKAAKRATRVRTSKTAVKRAVKDTSNYKGRKSFLQIGMEQATAKAKTKGHELGYWDDNPTEAHANCIVCGEPANVVKIKGGATVAGKALTVDCKEAQAQAALGGTPTAAPELPPAANESVDPIGALVKLRESVVDNAQQIAEGLGHDLIWQTAVIGEAAANKDLIASANCSRCAATVSITRVEDEFVMVGTAVKARCEKMQVQRERTNGFHKMNAVTLEAALVLYYSADPFVIDSTAKSKAIDFLQREQMVQEKDGRLALSDRGEVYIKGVLNLPLPVASWSMPVAQIEMDPPKINIWTDS